ncbi:MAG: helix-turn-helix domain-containing protein [Phycisphaerales bacterium]
MPESPALLTTKQASAFLGLPPRTIARHVSCNALPSVKIGRSRRFPITALNAWLAAGCPTEPGDGGRILADLRKGVRS